LRNAFLSDRAIDLPPLRIAVVDLTLGNTGDRVREAIAHNTVVALKAAMDRDLPEQLLPALEISFPRRSTYED